MGAVQKYGANSFAYFCSSGFTRCNAVKAAPGQLFCQQADLVVLPQPSMPSNVINIARVPAHVLMG